MAWFSDCVLGYSGQIVNLIFALVDPVPYYIFVNLLVANIGETHNLQLIDIRNGPSHRFASGVN